MAFEIANQRAVATSTPPRPIAKQPYRSTLLTAGALSSARPNAG